jgi:NAD(P)H-hydrate repair Nnr-like enzyme with NAD(P)H-hydrate dehydratase domain
MAKETATAFKQIVVLKGSSVVVTDGQRTHVNHTGDSSLAKAGELAGHKVGKRSALAHDVVSSIAEAIIHYEVLQ